MGRNIHPATLGTMNSDGNLSASPVVSVSYSPAKTRILTTALDLFAQHGISGTSLQMIADAVGVTKAAVYHQFNTKEEIVIASVEMELARLGPALDTAEADHQHPRSLRLLLTQVIDLAVEHRRMVVTLQHDPVVVRLLAEHKPFQQFMDRLFRALTGGKTSVEDRVQAAMISMAIGAASHPLVAGIDDDRLRSQLLQLTWKFLDLPE